MYHISPDVPRKLGNFTTFFHEVSGTVFELNEKFLLIKDFNYDGKGLAPIFLAGTTGGDGEVGEISGGPMKIYIANFPFYI